MLLSARNIAILLVLPTLSASARTENQPSFNLTISASQTFALGERVYVQALWKNVSNRAANMLAGEDYIVIIHDETGKILHPSRLGRSSSGGDVDVDPGKTFNESYELTGEYDLSVPESYTVKFRRAINPEDPKSPIIESNEITFSVVTPKKHQPQ